MRELDHILWVAPDAASAATNFTIGGPAAAAETFGLMKIAKPLIRGVTMPIGYGMRSLGDWNMIDRLPKSKTSPWKLLDTQEIYDENKRK